MKVAIVTSGYLPVPASLGGAVECLDDYIIKENEKQAKCELVVFSCYNKKSEDISRALVHTCVEFIKTPALIRVADWFIYYIVKTIKPHSQTMSYRYILKRLYFIDAVAKKLNSENYDRVMIENHATLLITLKKKNNYRKYEKRYFYHLHNEQNNLYGCEEVIKNVRKIGTVSGYISGCIKRKVPDLSSEQVTVWRNCVNSERFGSDYSKQKAIEMRSSLGIGNEELVILFTGRLSPEKGIKELLKAFSDVKNEKVRLVIAGGYLSGDTKVSNKYEKELKDLAKQIGDKIIFTGFVEYNDIPVLYQIADIVVVPSIWNDPAPLTVIETITSGVPLITTNSGGIIEYADEQCAIILERDDKLVYNLTRSIENLLNNPKKRKEMSIAALERSKNWTISEFYNNFLECLEIKK